MTHEEVADIDDVIIPGDMLGLADSHINFTDPGDIEFLVFKHRLSAAVLMSEVATSSLEKLSAERRQLRQTGAHRVPGWEGECDLLLNEEEAWITSTLRSIMYGAAEMAAVAALEGLIDDLRPEGARLRGLIGKADAYLKHVKAPQPTRERIQSEIRQLAVRRNAYAHELDGSPWAARRVGFALTDCEQGFHLIGHLAVELIWAREGTDSVETQT